MTISLHAIEDGMARRAQAPVEPMGLSLANVVNDANLVSLLLSVADYAGWQDDGAGGGFQLWTLRKAILGHPAGSTVTRETIRRALFSSSYGAVLAPTQKPQDFAAVESPGA